VQVVNAIPNVMLNNTTGFSMNIGNFGLKVGVNNNNQTQQTQNQYQQQNTFTQQQQNYVPPQINNTQLYVPFTGYQGNTQYNPNTFTQQQPPIYVTPQINNTQNYKPNTGYQGNNTGFGYQGNMNYYQNFNFNNNQQNTFIGLNVQRGQNYGNKHNDTRSFDHFSYIPTNSNYPIRQIKLYGSTYVNGIQISYELRGPTPLELGNQNNPYESVLNLETGEFITEVSGRVGNLIDRLEIRTNLGKSISVGGNGGSPFNFSIPYGSQVVGFYGGVGGHLHNIGIYTA